MVNSVMMLKARLYIYMVLLPLVNEASPRGYGYKQLLIKVGVIILSIFMKVGWWFPSLFKIRGLNFPSVLVLH